MNEGCLTWRKVLQRWHNCWPGSDDKHNMGSVLMLYIFSSNMREHVKNSEVKKAAEMKVATAEAEKKS